MLADLKAQIPAEDYVAFARLYDDMREQLIGHKQSTTIFAVSMILAELYLHVTNEGKSEGFFENIEKTALSFIGDFATAEAKEATLQ